MAAIEVAPADHLDLGEHNHHAVGLRRDALNFTETLAQSIANIAPTLTPAVNLQLVYASSGNGTWFTYLLATLGLLLIGVCIKHFASKTSTPGALYSYVSMSLGPTAGFITGWALILAYVTTGIAVASYTVPYFQTLLGGIHIPSLVLFAVVVALVWLIAFKDVRLSAKMMLTMEGLSVGLILILGVLVVAHTGLHLGPQLSLKGMTLNGLQGGMVLGVFSFVGFESATALGAEAKNPQDQHPARRLPQHGPRRHVLHADVVRHGLGLLRLQDAPGRPEPGRAARAGRHRPRPGPRHPALGGRRRQPVRLLPGLRHRRLAGPALHEPRRPDPRQFGKAHDTNATPHVAATASAAIMLLVLFGLTLKGYGPLDIYNMNGTISTYGFLVAYVLIAVGSVVSAAREKAVTPWLALSALGGILLMGIAIKGSVSPWPTAPDNYLPYVFAGYMVLGILWMLFDRARGRTKLEMAA